MLTASQDAVDCGLAPEWKGGIFALADGGSLAYLAPRPVDDERAVFEFGACGHVIRKRHTTMVLSWPEGSLADTGQGK